MNGDQPAVAPPLTLASSAFEAAARPTLPEPQPLHIPSLPNVFRLSEQIISGGEPHDSAGFKAIAALGVRTIVSVDGKTPDAQAAAAQGLTYVHVPIRYRSITAGELLRLAKTFRELPGPFYVHCFHGKHRGPAAAAVGRLVVDGVDRSRVLAEMRQWCGTSEKYEGLYRTVALAAVPDAATTRSFAWNFPSSHAQAGLRAVMIEVSRSFDTVSRMSRNDWAVPEDHPDVDAVNEATILANLFTQAASLEQLSSRPDDFRNWIRQARQQSEILRDVLADVRRSGGRDWGPADEAYQAVKGTCSACHSAYRNE